MTWCFFPLRETTGQATSQGDGLVKKKPNEFKQSGLATWILFLVGRGPVSENCDHLIQYTSHQVLTTVSNVAQGEHYNGSLQLYKNVLIPLTSNSSR